MLWHHITFYMLWNARLSDYKQFTFGLMYPSQYFSGSISRHDGAGNQPKTQFQKPLLIVIVVACTIRLWIVEFFFLVSNEKKSKKCFIKVESKVERNRSFQFRARVVKTLTLLSEISKIPRANGLGMLVFQKSVCNRPSVSCHKILPVKSAITWVFQKLWNCHGWVFHKTVWLMPRKFDNKG